MKFISTIAAIAFALASTSAMAQTPPAATTAPAAKPAAPAAAATTTAKKERTPESLKCSADADAKNLHGSERKKFRDKCMKDAKKATKAVEPAKKN